MTNSRAIHNPPTSAANTRTHQDSTISMVAIVAANTIQSRKNQTIGAMTDLRCAKGANSFWNRKRDLSGAGASATSTEALRFGCIRHSRGKGCTLYTRSVRPPGGAAAECDLVPIRVGPEQHAEVFARLDERRGRLAGARIEP